MPDPSAILFSAFEPSGDALAAPLIAALRRREPGRAIYALGGERMAAAGAELIETTTEHPAMLLGAAGQAVSHQRRVWRLRRWLAEHGIAALVPTDAPAANWSICKAARRGQPRAKIVHLVAPQLWAWAPWRINKMRRLSDHAMCLLPFEAAWFRERGMPATFVGHPLFDAASAGDADAAPAGGGPVLPTDGEPRLALLPGSRRSEVQANWPTMLAAMRQLRQRYPGMRAVVAASSAARAEHVRSLCPGGTLPHRTTMVVADASAVLDWAEAALVVSGTATLHAASRGTPMVVLFNVSRGAWHLAGRWLMQTRTFSLPNLISEGLGAGRIVPELVPHFGQVEPVAAALDPLLRAGEARRAQLAGFETIAAAYAETPFAETAADVLERVLPSPSADPNPGA